MMSLPQALPPAYDRFFQALVSRDMIVARLFLRHIERLDLLTTPAGEKLLSALLTVHQNHNFKATMRLLNYCTEQEISSAGIGESTHHCIISPTRPHT
jgi:hypothetical protein